MAWLIAVDAGLGGRGVPLGSRAVGIAMMRRDCAGIE